MEQSIEGNINGLYQLLHIYFNEPKEINKLIKIKFADESTIEIPKVILQNNIPYFDNLFKHKIKETINNEICIKNYDKNSFLNLMKIGLLNTKSFLSETEIFKKLNLMNSKEEFQFEEIYKFFEEIYEIYQKLEFFGFYEKCELIKQETSNFLTSLEKKNGLVDFSLPFLEKQLFIKLKSHKMLNLEDKIKGSLKIDPLDLENIDIKTEVEFYNISIRNFSSYTKICKLIKALEKSKTIVHENLLGLKKKYKDVYQLEYLQVEEQEEEEENGVEVEDEDEDEDEDEGDDEDED